MTVNTIDNPGPAAPSTRPLAGPHDPRSVRAAHSHGSLAFGIWMDYDSGNKGWDAIDPLKNYFTPDRFGQSVRKALATTDEYVWIYTERTKWWDANGKPEKLPPAYEAALRRARNE